MTVPEGERFALMDGSRLAQAFENLITNAIQYSTRGQAVSISEAETEGFAEWEIRDRGAGFIESDLPRIFQPFFTRRRGGTGLGLAIVQRIIDQHGGMVAAKNHPDGGAVVR